MLAYLGPHTSCEAPTRSVYPRLLSLHDHSSCRPGSVPLSSDDHIPSQISQLISEKSDMADSVSESGS